MSPFMAKIRDSDVVREMTLPLFGISMYAALGGMSFGIDNNYWSGVLGMDKFKEDFGVYSPSSGEYVIPTSWESAGTGAPTAGMAVGALISGTVGGLLGRIRTFQLAASICLVGIVIQCAAIHSYWQIMAGRIVTSIGLGLTSNAVPAYQAECAPSKVRGTLVNCYQFTLILGSLLINITNWGVHARTDQWAYRLSIVLQLIAPLVLGVGSLIMPESPRWLIGRGRDAEALSIMKMLRRGTTSDELLEQEVQLLVAAEEENRSRNLNSEISWLDCFRGTNLRRTLIMIGVQCLQQAQGASFIGNYAVVFLQRIGVSNTYEIQILLSFCSCVGCWLAFYLPDRLGRRPIMITSASIMTVCMYCIAGITGFGLADDTNAVKGAIVCLCIWKILVNIGWSSCVWIVTAEAATLQLREKSITIATSLGYCVSVMVTFINPYMQDEGYGNLGGRVGFVYGSFSVMATIWSFFLLPETGRRSLEELDELFEKRVPTLRFSQYKTSGYGAQLAEIEDMAKSDGGVVPKHIVTEAMEVDERPDRDAELGDANLPAGKK